MLREEEINNNDEINAQSNNEEDLMIQQEFEKINEQINQTIVEENQKNEEEEKPIIVTCKSAKVIGEGMKAYAVFEIQLETRLSGFPGEKIVVDRRYSDFHHLREKLLEKHLSLIVPPIPEKDWQNLFSQSNDNKFPKEFLNYRRRQLQQFLRLISDHPKLRESQEFKDFFKSTSREEKSNNRSITSVFSNLLGGAKSSVQSLKTSISTIEEPDEWFIQKTKLINDFCEQLELIANYSNTICNHYLSICSLYSSISKCSQNISQEKFDDENFSQNFSLLSQTFSEIVPQINTSIARQAIQFRDLLFFYVRYLNSAKVTLQNRTKVLLEYQTAEKNFEAKKNSTNKTEVSKLEIAYNDKKFNYETFSEEVKNEIMSFEKEYTAQIMDAIIKFGQFNKDMNNQNSDVFKQFLSKVSV